MQNGIPVGLRSSPSFGLSRSGQLTAIIQSLFWDGSQGWWYDDNDTTTLFQDSAGTTPVTAVEQFVGLQLDKSKGLVLGPELVTNGTFTTDTTGWTVSAGTFTSVSGQGQLTGAAPAIAGTSFTTIAGKFYVLVMTQDVNSAIRIGNSLNGSEVLGTTNPGSGTTTRYFVAASTTTWITLRASSTTNYDNISVRELPGNHRYAPASGNRPIWSKRVNLLTKTEQFDDAAWVKSNVTVVANATLAPNGTLTADKLYPVSTGSNRFLYQVLSLASGFYKWSLKAKAAEKSIVYIDFTGAGTTRAFFNLAAGTVGTVASGYTATITDLGSGWYECTGVNSVASSYNFGGVYGVADADGSASVTANGTDGIYLWGADLRPANQATGTMPLYQRVNTSSDYDTNGFPGYLKADGIDDFLQTNSIDFSAGPTNPPLGPESRANGVISLVGSATAATYNTSTGAGSVTRVDSSNQSFIQWSGFSANVLVRVDISCQTNAIAVRSGTQTGSIAQTVSSGQSLLAYVLTDSNGRFAITNTTAASTSTFTVASVKEITNANLGADKITLCAGVRKLSDAVAGFVAELSPSTTTNNGAFALANSYGFGANWTFALRGNSGLAERRFETYAAPITNVIVGILDINGATITEEITGRVNGATPNYATQNLGPAGGGNLGNYPAYFFRRGGTTLPFNGYEYGNVAVGKLLTADQLRALETYMNGLTKAY